MKKAILLTLIVIALLANVAFAADSSFRYGEKKPDIIHPTTYYGVGQPCVMTASYYGVTATAQQGPIVHVILVTKQGVNDVGKNTKTGALLQGLQLVQTMCGDTFLLLPNADQEKVKPFLIAKK